ncbi:MAG: TPR domain-containing protein [Vibrio sp.]
MLIALFCLIMFAAATSAFCYQKNQAPKHWIVLSIIFCISFSLFLYVGLGAPKQFSDFLTQSDAPQTQSEHPFNQDNPKLQLEVSEYIAHQQDLVKKDPQDGEAWYALGDAYMYANQYQNADLAFSYAQRLADAPQANIFAARASAQYYGQGQKFTPQVQSLLHQALSIDPTNTASLMLLASEQFLSAQYTQAIANWQKILDSGKPKLDRVSLIKNIHQAQSLCQCQG